MTVIKVGIYGSRVDHLLERNVFLDLAIVAVQHDLDVRVIEDVLEHAREPVERHRLIQIGKVAIVAIGTCRHARRYTRIKLRRIESPLLPRVVTKEFLVQLPADFTDNDIFRCPNSLDGFGMFLKKLVHFKRCQIQSVESIDRVEIYRDRNYLAVHTCPNTMLIRTPFGET